MSSKNIREKLHYYVDKGDEKLLKIMYVVAKEYNNEDDFEYEFTDEEIRTFEERKAKRLNGESKSYSWDQAKDIITGENKTG